MDLVKSMLDNSREFFTRLEDLEKSFLTGLTEGHDFERSLYLFVQGRGEGSSFCALGCLDRCQQ